MTTTSEILDCGHTLSEHSPHTTGYGVRADGKKYCYACCTLRDREDMARAKHIVAFLSENGRYATNWPGGILGAVTDERTRKMWGFGGRHDRVYVRVLAADGSRWHGSGPGRGMYLRLHRCKGAGR